MKLLAAVTLIALLLAPGCVSVLGLDEFSDAIQALCKCDEAVPQFDGDCVDVLTMRLDNVSEPTRAAWLAHYSENCAGGCGSAFACYQQPATCSKFTCGVAEECCGFSEGVTMCIDGECG